MSTLASSSRKDLGLAQLPLEVIQQIVAAVEELELAIEDSEDETVDEQLIASKPLRSE